MNPKQLTFVREYKGYSQTELSSNIKGLSQSNLSKFEMGVGQLSEEVQQRIIDFLGFPAEFYEQSISNNVENAHYRKKAGLTKKQKEYIDRYEQAFAGHITPRSCWLPWTQDVNEINDRKKLLSNKNYSNAVNNPALYDAVCNLAECFIDEETLNRPEVF